MSEMLRADTDEIIRASMAIGMIKVALNGGLANVDSSVGALQDHWKGQTAESFYKWWYITGQQYTKAIQLQLQSIQVKLQKVAKVIDESDEQMSAWFK
jgi:WXG100 family type VII secretion target